MSSDFPCIRLVLAQLNLLVGDLDGNARKIIQAGHQAQQQYKADMLVVPEQALIGYPAEDLLLQPQLCRCSVTQPLRK